MHSGSLSSRLTSSALQIFRRYLKAENHLSIQLDITNACNLRCSHCYHSNHINDGALDFSGWLNVLDQYQSLLNKLKLTPAITICGGEPTSSPHLKPLLEEANRRWPGVSFLILTNGTLINEEKTQLFKEFNVRVQVSLDGANEASHDFIRGAGSFEKAILGIRQLIQQGISTSILTVLSKRSAPHIKDFFNLAKSLGVSKMSFTRLIEQGTGLKLVTSGQDRSLTPFELKAAFTQIISYSKESKVPTGSTSALYHLIDPSFVSSGKFGFQGVIVDYKGNLKVSSRTRFTLGTLRESSMEQLFLDHPVMRALRNGEIRGCGTCPFYKKCGGDRNAAFMKTGSFLEPDPGCWIFEENIKTPQINPEAI